MVHGVELIREGYFGSAINAHYDVVYLTSCSAILTLVGLVQVRALGRKVIPA
jgi:ABC-type polysaccharide/polyol phosphate export permease